MIEPSSDAASKLLDQFIALRKSGKNRDDAWYMVLDQAGEIAADLHKKFLHLAKDWEKTQGHLYRYQTRTDATETIIAPKSDPTKTQTLPAPKIEITEPTHGTTVQMNSVDPVDESIQEVATYFDTETQLSFYFRDFPDVVTVDVPMGHEVVIGRSTPNAAMSPDVDLSSLKAEAFGVSRMHAMLRRRQNALYLSDLGSRNFTYLNGRRLHSHEVRVVKDGDEVMFGQLVARVHFHKGHGK